MTGHDRQSLKPSPAPRPGGASDAINWWACHRRVWFDLHHPERAAPPDAFEKLIMQAGIDHERAVLSALGPCKRPHTETETAALMRERAPLIYQPRVADPEHRVVARPDFLILEQGGYRAADAKLARSLKDKPGARVQLAVYQKLLGTTLSTQALLADGHTEFTSEKDLERADEFLRDLQALTHSEMPPAHFSASRCKACAYRNTCIPQFQRDSDLGLNYFVDSRAIPHLNRAGVQSLGDLANRDPASLPDMPYLRGTTKSRAVLHAKALLDGELRLQASPAPIAGTAIHFDIETNPLASDAPEEVYLWGFLPPPYRPEDFEFVWHDGGADNDQRCWQQFLAHASQLRERIPDAVLVHYANFERQVIKRYAKRYESLQHPVVEWLLDGGGLFDLRDTVMEALILPTIGYGLKEICKHRQLVNFQWQLEESGSQWSVVRYHDFLGCTDSAEREHIRQDIIAYNRDDVRATRALELWLNELPAAD